jgi:hypothetical protein
MKKLFVHGATYDANGLSSCHFSTEVDFIEKPMQHHLRGLQFTASGYGSRLPTVYMVRFNDKWRRVYARCFSNTATLYIGKLCEVGERLIVRDYQ